MSFRIADTFTASLARLTREEQKCVETTAFDLRLNPANPGMKFHRLRLIVHRRESSLLLCYVDHHDGAYRWAESHLLYVACT